MLFYLQWLLKYYKNNKTNITLLCSKYTPPVKSAELLFCKFKFTNNYTVTITEFVVLQKFTVKLL